MQYCFIKWPTGGDSCEREVYGKESTPHFCDFNKLSRSQLLVSIASLNHFSYSMVFL